MLVGCEPVCVMKQPRGMRVIIINSFVADRRGHALRVSRMPTGHFSTVPFSPPPRRMDDKENSLRAFHFVFCHDGLNRKLDIRPGVDFK